jgi:PAS domain S-box-containing protein/diguanylate cyclase (GGDEF)-like protein
VRSAFESAFTQAPIGMALVDMTGRLLRVNDALCRITGYTADEVCARSFRDLSDPDDDDVDAQQIVDLIEGRTRRYQIEKRYRHASGHPVWVLVIVSLVRDDEDRPLHLIAQVQDITHRKELEGRLGQLVDHDFLTTLFNSRRFEQALAQEIKSAARYGGGGALLLLDLDHFKVVNDRFGHKAGDDLLKTVAAALRSRIRETDVLARLGDFVRGFGANPTDQLVVEAIVGIARGMKKKTVAEFVTDQDTLDRLRRSGIDYAQGFHIGMPRPIVETFAQERAVPFRTAPSVTRM